LRREIERFLNGEFQGAKAGVDINENIGKIMPMKELTMPIGKARSNLCGVVKKVQSGVRVTLTSHGRPQAVIVPVENKGKPWRVGKPDDPSRYGDLQSPVMEDWK